MSVNIPLTRVASASAFLARLTDINRERDGTWGLGTKLEIKDVIIETKSKQNYSSEWESASFRATVRKMILNKKY